jgi:hypothetical protein
VHTATRNEIDHRLGQPAVSPARVDTTSEPDTRYEQHRLSAGHDPFTVEHAPCPYRYQPPPRSHACRTTIRARPLSNCAGDGVSHHFLVDRACL